MTPQLFLANNVEYRLFDNRGRAKKLFQENALAQILIGKVGLLSPHWQSWFIAPLLEPFLGHWTYKRTVSNLITNAGKALAAGRLMGSGSPAAPSYIAVGTGTTAASATDTALETELATSGLSRVLATLSLVTVTVTNDGARATTTFSVSGSAAVTESGLLNASSSGTLLARQVFSAINVVNGDSLVITWTVKNS